MNEVVVKAGQVVKGLSTRPGRACSAFSIHTLAVISREGITSLVGVQMDGRFAGEVTSRRVDRIVPFDLTVEDGEALDIPLGNVWLTRPDAQCAYVEDLTDRPNKRKLLNLKGGMPITDFVVDEARIPVADEADLEFLAQAQ